MENLVKAFIGESQARNRYTIYAKWRKKKGMNRFLGFSESPPTTSTSTKTLFGFIQELKQKLGGPLDEIKVEAAAPTVWGKTAENLKAAIAGENYEHTTMYLEFAKVADQERLKNIANRPKSLSDEGLEHRSAELLIIPMPTRAVASALAL